MQTSQFSFREIGSVFYRRIKLLSIPPIAVTALAVAVTSQLPRMYESSTSILVQRNEVQNPISGMTATAPSYQMEDDPLRFIDEILYSRKTIEMLLDSLNVEYLSLPEALRRKLIDDRMSNIKIQRQARESFSIIYADDDPIRAQRGAGVLADLFMQTTSSTLNQRNEVTVRFYEQKLEEFRQKLEQSQEQLMPRLRDRMQDNPAAGTYLRDVEKQMQESEARAKELKHDLVLIRELPEDLSSKPARQTLFELSRLDIPYASELRGLVTKHDDALGRYTERHPEVTTVQVTILEMLERMAAGIQGEINKQESRTGDLRRTRTQMMSDMLGASAQSGQEKESNLAVYQRLYDGMKVKLEEAQIQRAIGKTANNQFTIIDPPLVPLKPSKPNRALIVGGGFGLGLLLGIVSAILSELFDSTIRTTHIVELYHKPIIAFLPERPRLKD
ncbi:MAG TPA: GNVR domain-containing protein [Bacteroidota bacterium]|nr:GNVR domain-containing protein [Bacteroidota bacterium]